MIVACAMFMAQLDASVILVAIPEMSRGFGVKPVDLSLGITIYILAQTVLLPGSAWIAENYGPRKVFTLAIAGFTAASVLCAASQSLEQFVLSRALQGIAAALMAPVARIVLLQTTGKEDLIRAMTISTIPMLLAPTLGPLIGGLVLTYLSWHWIFLLNVPVGLLGMMLAVRFIPTILPGAQTVFDRLGFILMGAATGGVLIGFDRVSAGGTQWVWGVALLAVGVILGILAIGHLRRHPTPILSLGAARVTTFYLTTLGTSSLVRLPVRATSFIVPLLFQEAMGYTPLYSGFALLAMSLGDLVLKPMTTRAFRRFGFRRVLTGSTLVVTVTLAAFALLAVSSPYCIGLAILALSGMARSLLFAGMNTLAFADVPRSQLSSASVLLNIVQQVTNAVGVTLAAMFMNISSFASGEPVGIVSSWNCEMALLGMSLLGAFSLCAFARLPSDAGAEMSGYKG